jgi:hypothetical protein
MKSNLIQGINTSTLYQQNQKINYESKNIDCIGADSTIGIDRSLWFDSFIFFQSSRSFSRVPPNSHLGVKTVANRTAKVGVYSLSVSPYKSGGSESGFIVEVKYNNINLTIG